LSGQKTTSGTTGITPYHAKYFAYDLTRQSASEGVERLSSSLFNALVDLNPHQIEAALFAMRSPLSHGVILADEVGLGKTIEAGLVIKELKLRGKVRRVLVIAPHALATQWQSEMRQRFNEDFSIIVPSDLAAVVASCRQGGPGTHRQPVAIV